MDAAPVLVSLAASAGEPMATESESLPTFTGNAYSGGFMYPNLSNVDWKGPVVVDLAGVRIPDQVPFHRDHDSSRPVGHGTANVLDGQLHVSGVLSVPGQDRDDLVASAKAGFPWKLSVGLSEMTYERITAGETISVNGRTFDGPLLVVKSATLHEVSFLSVPGDLTTDAAIAAQANLGASDMDFAAWLSARGMDSATMSEAELALAKKIYDAEAAMEAADEAAEADAGNGESHDEQHTATAGSSATASATAGRGTTTTTTNTAGSVDLAAQRAALADEEERVAAIREIGNTIGNPAIGQSTLVATAIRDGWTVQRAALEASRAARPRGPAIHSTSRAERGSMDVLQAAVLLRAGRRIDVVVHEHRHVPGWMSRAVNDTERQRVMDRAQEFRDCSMIDLLQAGLRAQGRQVPSARLAVLEAAFSTGATQAIFTQSVGAMALTAYQETADFSRGWCSETDQLNLMPAERVRLAAAPDLRIHPSGGTADHAQRSATAEMVKVDRFSRTAKIDENDFINDNFGLLRDTPIDFGRAAARLRPNLVAAVLLNNGNLADGTALFHSSRGNARTSSALNQANFQAARAVLGKMRDGDASLNLPTTHLLVPTDLGDLAVQLTRSAVISNDSGTGSTNPIYMRNVEPVEEARLANGIVDPVTGNTVAGSTTSWYVISAEGKTIEVQYLQGAGRQPQVVVEQLREGEFGLSITVKHFCGAKALDWRSIVRNAA